MRSITSCMKEAYSLLLTNYKSLVKKTYLVALTFSVFLSVTYYFFLPNKSLHDWGVKQPIMAFVVQTVVYIATFIFFVLYQRSVWKWIPHDHFKIGLRYVGRIVSLVVLGILLVVCLGCIVVLPTIILSVSQIQSQIGALSGDALGVPSYFTFLLFLTLVVTFFVMSYLTAWLNIACKYLCASITVQNVERHKMKEDNQSYLNIK